LTYSQVITLNTGDGVWPSGMGIWELRYVLTEVWLIFCSIGCYIQHTVT